ncbi:MAG: AAA family ATPase [Bacilli bacterium]|nr:AAA family ATPase [Bacilli bacterium]
MSDKEKLRQQLLEQTLGKNAKNRRLSSVSDDLQQILDFQRESLKELSQNISQDELDRINKEMEKDFGITFDKDVKKDIQSLDIISTDLKKKWHYDETIDDILSFVKKSELVEKKEYSLLIYDYQDIKKVIEDIAIRLNENHFLKTDDISYIDFSSYSQKIEIFYQDMYECLYGAHQFIVLDYIERLPVTFLSSMISLLKDKKISLMNRYVESQGTLKETNNVLVKNAFSSLEWNNKYIILLSHDSLSSLTDKLGSPFIKAIDEVKKFIDLKQDDYQQLIIDKVNQLIQKIERQLKLKVNGDLSKYIIHEKITDIDIFLEDVLEELIDLKYKYDINEVNIKIDEDKIYVTIDNVDIPLFEEDHSSFEEIDNELQGLVGLNEVKEYLGSLKQYYTTYQRRKAQGKKVMDVSKHMIFTGNPGTGKTTVARILAKYLKTAGILESGHLIEVSRKDLVGQYVGHTAVLTSQVIDSALGGVLFIDEAYSLYRGQNDSFGLEAIDTLVKAMEDKRDNLVVVLAGYAKEMEEFLTANSGLRSRFSNIIEFKDYTGDELCQIACNIAKGKDYVIDESCKEALMKYLTKRNILEGGNGRLARNVVEKAMIHQSMRGSDDDILILDDFMEGSEVIE